MLTTLISRKIAASLKILVKLLSAPWKIRKKVAVLQLLAFQVLTTLISQKILVKWSKVKKNDVKNSCQKSNDVKILVKSLKITKSLSFRCFQFTLVKKMSTSKKSRQIAPRNDGDGQRRPCPSVLASDRTK